MVKGVLKAVAIFCLVFLWFYIAMNTPKQMKTEPVLPVSPPLPAPKIPDTPRERGYLKRAKLKPKVEVMSFDRDLRLRVARNDYATFTLKVNECIELKAVPIPFEVRYFEVVPRTLKGKQLLHIRGSVCEGFILVELFIPKGVGAGEYVFDFSGAKVVLDVLFDEQPDTVLYLKRRWINTRSYVRGVSFGQDTGGQEKPYW